MADENLNTTAGATDPAMLDTQEIASAVSAAASEGAAVLGDSSADETPPTGSAGDLVDARGGDTNAKAAVEAQAAVRAQQQAIRDNAGDASMAGTAPAQRPSGPHGVGDSTGDEPEQDVVQEPAEERTGTKHVVDGQIVRD